jgi:hypothetical protein
MPQIVPCEIDTRFLDRPRKPMPRAQQPLSALPMNIGPLTRISTAPLPTLCWRSNQEPASPAESHSIEPAR